MIYRNPFVKRSPPPNPDFSNKKEEEKDKKEAKNSESEYEDVTDPEFDAFNSDDSTEKGRMIPVNYNWGGKGKIQKRNIKVRIKIFVKTFYGDRKRQEIFVNINDKIETLLGTVWG